MNSSDEGAKPRISIIDRLPPTRLARPDEAPFVSPGIGLIDVRYDDTIRRGIFPVEYKGPLEPLKNWKLLAPYYLETIPLSRIKLCVTEQSPDGTPIPDGRQFYESIPVGKLCIARFVNDRKDGRDTIVIVSDEFDNDVVVELPKQEGLDLTEKLDKIALLIISAQSSFNLAEINRLKSEREALLHNNATIHNIRESLAEGKPAASISSMRVNDILNES